MSLFLCCLAASGPEPPSVCLGGQRGAGRTRRNRTGPAESSGTLPNPTLQLWSHQPALTRSPAAVPRQQGCRAGIHGFSVLPRWLQRCRGSTQPRLGHASSRAASLCPVMGEGVRASPHKCLIVVRPRRCQSLPGSPKLPLSSSSETKGLTPSSGSSCCRERLSAEHSGRSSSSVPEEGLGSPGERGQSSGGAWPRALVR